MYISPVKKMSYSLAQGQLFFPSKSLCRETENNNIIIFLLGTSLSTAHQHTIMTYI